MATIPDIYEYLKSTGNVYGMGWPNYAAAVNITEDIPRIAKADVASTNTIPANVGPFDKKTNDSVVIFDELWSPSSKGFIFVKMHPHASNDMISLVLFPKVNKLWSKDNWFEIGSTRYSSDTNDFWTSHTFIPIDETCKIGLYTWTSTTTSWWLHHCKAYFIPQITYASPDCVSYVIESGSNEYGFYRKYSDGYIEQWGTRSGISQTIDLPISFTSTNYSVQFTHIDADGHQGAPTFEIISKSESSFTMKAWTTGSTISNITSTDGQLDWKACGY